MSVVTTSKDLWLGAGKLFFNRLNKLGQPTGERPLGNAPEFTLTTATEKKEKYSSMDAAKGLLESIVTKVTITAKTKLDYFSPANLALALMGEEGVYTQVAEADKDVQFTKVTQGMFYNLGYKAVKDVVVAPTPASTPYVLGTDYKLDVKTGRIEIIVGGGIADGSDIDVTFDVGECAMVKISGGVAKKIEGYLHFVGDPTMGPAYEGEFWRVSITPDGDLGFISEDWGSIGLTIDVQNDSEHHPDDPYYRLLK
jgi:hypothetical protein